MKQKNNFFKTFRTIVSGAILMFSVHTMQAQSMFPIATPDGYASKNGGTTGGDKSNTVTVTSAAAFKAAAESSASMVIIVDGFFDIGPVNVKSNKTIMGKNTSSGYKGDLQLSNVKNIIIQNLNITNPSGVGTSDGIEASVGCTNIFVTKCTFTDCSDGSIDMKRGSDFLTVSWCRFRYPGITGHNFPSLVGHSDSNGAQDRGKLHITMHHNWYDVGCNSRMPRVRFGYVHEYNVLFACPGNNYCIGTGVECHIRLENSVFENVNRAWNDMAGMANGGQIGWNNIKFVNTALPTYAPNKWPVFTPDYSYTMHGNDELKGIVTDATFGAGNCQPKGTTIIPVTGVTVSPTSAIINKNTTTQLTATVLPTNASNQGITWTSSNTSVATVNASGLVTGVAKGSATITVKTNDGGKTATCTVTVNDIVTPIPVTGVTVIPTTASVVKGTSIQLTATVAPSNATNKTVSWSTSNASIATVSSTGLVTGIIKGSATITVTTTDGSKTATCAVTVTDTPNATTITIQENATGFCSVDGTIDSNNAGFTGTGFANSNNAINAGITWSISVPSAGTYTLAWRNANGTTAARTAKVLVDGVAVVSSLSFPVSGSWTTWINTSTTLNLTAGTRKIRLQANLAGGLPNIDNLSVTGLTPTPIACVGLKSASSLESAINDVSDKIVLSPNPVENGVINISGNLIAKSKMKISIYNEVGKLILSRNMGVYEKGNFVVSIPASTIKPGFYVVKVQMDAGVKTMSFIKK